MIILHMHVGTKGLNQQCAACSDSPRNVEWTALQAIESLVLLYLNSVLLAYSWECVNTVNTPPLFAHYFEAKVRREGAFARILILSRTFVPPTVPHTIAQQLPGGSGWMAALMDAYYRKSVVFVLKLSQEASKQLTSSVVTGDDPM